MLETTAGLRALAVALPRWRVERSLIAEAWGRRGSPGARPVCGHDEDSLTLCCDALAAVRRSTAGIVLCASTTAPHAERASSAVLVRALRLPDSVLATDVSGTARAGTAAALQAGAWARDGAEVLLAAADRRDAEPGSDLEALLGDAGAAACIGPAAAGDLAHLVGSASLSGDAPDTWRLAGEAEVRRADPAFAPRRTMPGPVAAAIRRALDAAGLTPDAVTGLAVSAVDARSIATAALEAGVPEAAAAPAERVAGLVGFTGAAAPWLALAAALEHAAPSDAVVQVGYGEGSADALVWRVAEGVSAWRNAGAGLPADLSALEPVPSYARFLRLRGRLPREVPEPYSSLPLVAREEEQDVALSGSECVRCGRFTYPMRRLCERCGGRELRPRALGRRGVVVTFTEDHIVPNPEPPTVMAVADMEGGGRFYAQLSAPPGLVATGLRVELMLRRLHDAGGWPHYFWKMRPAVGAVAPVDPGGRGARPEAGVTV